MCFVHKHMQNADFGQILSRRASTKKLRDLTTDFRKLGIKRCVRLERKKSWKSVSRSAAVATQSRISCRGGSNWPPPPVKIAYLCPNMINFDAMDFSERRPEEVMSFFWHSVYFIT